MFKEKYYQKRWYDGEHEFRCGQCNAVTFDYLFDDEDPSCWHTSAGDFFSKQQPPLCPQCRSNMSWMGCSGDTRVKESMSGAILSLIRGDHFMAACLVFSSVTEYQLNSLLWAVLVDAGYEREKAAEYADGSLTNGEVVRLLRILLSRNLKTIVLPARNDMVHGREFGNPSNYFIKKLNEMKNSVKHWVSSFERYSGDVNESELDKWFLYMQHWLAWCDQRFPQNESSSQSR